MTSIAAHCHPSAWSSPVKCLTMSSGCQLMLVVQHINVAYAGMYVPYLQGVQAN